MYIQTLSELPVKFVKPLVDLNGIEDQSVTFECEISKAKWKKTGNDVVVKWCKGERELRDTAKYSISRDGIRHSLTIKQLMFEDVSDYSAIVLIERTSGKLTIGESEVSFTAKLKDVEVNEKETAQLDCEVSKTHSSKNAEPLPVSWYKLVNDKEEKLVHDGRIETHKLNKKLVLKINNALVEDAGTYVVSIGDVKAQAKLIVNEIPVIFKRPLEDQRSKEGQSCTFECTVNRSDKPISWFVNGKLITKEDISSGKYAISQDKNRLQLVINNLDLATHNNAEITCQVGDKAKTVAKLTVDEGDIKFIERLVDSGVKENEPIQFVFKLNKLRMSSKPHEELTIKWFVKGKEIDQKAI